MAPYRRRTCDKYLHKLTLTHLSPIGWEHVNLTGDYTWQASRRLRKGSFRPLRGMATIRYKMGHLLNAMVPAIGFREEGLREPGHFQSEPSPKLLHRRSYYRSAPRSNRDLTISVQRTTWKVRFQRVSGKKCTRTWPIHAIF